MSIAYKVDVLALLKEKGYSSYRLRKEKIFGEKTIQALRVGDLVSFDVINKLCAMLNCDVGDILVYVPDEIE